MSCSTKPADRGWARRTVAFGCVPETCFETTVRLVGVAPGRLIQLVTEVNES